MSRIYVNGYEHGTTTTGVEFDTSSVSGGSAATIETTIVRNSKNSIKFVQSTGLCFHGAKFYDSKPGTPPDLYYSFDFYISGNNYSTARPFFQAEYGSNLRHWALYINDSFQISLVDRAGTSVATGSTLSTNTWYRIEVWEDYAASSTDVTVRLDGVTNISATNVGDATGDFSLAIKYGAVDTFFGSQATMYFDNIRINNSLLSNDNSWCGEGYIRHAYPNGDAASASQTWDLVGAATSYEALDDEGESTANIETDYVERTNTLDVDHEVLMDDVATIGISSSDTINSVGVGSYCGATSNTTGNRTATLYYRTVEGGAKTSSSTLNWSINGWGANYDENAVNVVGVRAGNLNLYTYSLTGSDIDNLRLGASAVTGSTQAIRLAYIWACIDYVPAAATTRVRDMVQSIGMIPFKR